MRDIFPLFATYVCRLRKRTYVPDRGKSDLSATWIFSGCTPHAGSIVEILKKIAGRNGCDLAKREQREA